MAKIDTSGWQKFIIGDLFEKLDTSFLGKGVKKRAVQDHPDEIYCVPLTYAKRYNNGIMYWGKVGDFKTHKNALSVIYNGAVSAGRVYAQSEETGVLAESYMIKLKDKDVSFNTYLFLQRVIEICIYSRFSYSDLAVWPSVQKEAIWLPVDTFGEPDWPYMDEYMTGIMGLAQEISDKLAEEEFAKVKVDINGWREFKMGELFNIVKGKRLTKANMVEGETNFIGSSAVNNGITARIGNTEYVHAGGVLTVCYNGSVGETFFQDEEFWASDDVNILDPKKDVSRNAMLFVGAVIRHAGQSYSWANKWTRDVMLTTPITLPATESGDPDWEYMDSYMSKIMDESRVRVDSLEQLAK
jgi:hypothetical protein